jgi:hypothetical protein
MKKILLTATALALAFQAPIWAEEPITEPGASDEVKPAVEDPTAEEGGSDEENGDGGEVEEIVDVETPDIIRGGGAGIVHASIFRLVVQKCSAT